MRALDRKLWRDLWRMRVQALAVALVVGCGAAIYIMAVGMRDSLSRTRLAYYAERGMADIAAPVVRAPERLRLALADIPGVQAVETRIIGGAILELAGVHDPLSARLVSLPASGRPRVDDLVLASGRLPDPLHPNETLFNAAFAEANRLEIGALVPAVIHGKRQMLRMVGTANAPEFIYVAAPGEFYPQPGRFGVAWMGREALGRAFDLDDAFNEAILRASPDADRNAILRGVDDVLRPFGGGGAYGRDRMVSDRFITEELKQLTTMAASLPPFFLVIAAFLVAVSQGRLVDTERSSIGLLKAFGYPGWRIGLHYIESALLMAGVGCIVGYFGGVALGQWMASVYRVYYRFPRLDFIADPATVVTAMAAALAAAASGGAYAALRAARLSPVQALNPPQPTTFRQASGWTAKLGRRLDSKSRIIARRILRFPGRSLATALGFGLAISILVVTETFPAAIEEVLRLSFKVASREDATLTFNELKGPAGLYAAGHLPGVIKLEPFRSEEVAFSNGSHTAREALVGIAENVRLKRTVDVGGNVLPIRGEGVTLSRALAKKLDAKPGDILDAEMTRGARRRVALRVVAVADPLSGSAAYMELEAMSRVLREPFRYSGAYVTYDARDGEAFGERLKNLPALAGVSFARQGEAASRSSFRRGVGRMNLIYSTFAAIMAGGVAFSSARVTFAEQQRDLATLRVLGFTRLETSYVLVGEILALFLASIPFGLLFGLAFARWLMSTFETDLYAFPFVINPPGYAYAVLFTLACVFIAALWVRRGIDRLDMVAVLKTRD